MSRGRSRRALTRNQSVVERQDRVADDLPRLVALPGDEHDVSFAGGADGFGDGFAPPGDFRYTGCARHHVSADTRRVFAPGIVVSDDHNVREARGDRSHLRSLALITVAARPENGD